MSKIRTSPRRFSEKIALLNKKEFEATNEFIKILKEVEETTRATIPTHYNNERIRKKRASYCGSKMLYDTFDCPKSTPLSPTIHCNVPQWVETGKQNCELSGPSSLPIQPIEVPSIKIFHINDDDYAEQQVATTTTTTSMKYNNSFDMSYVGSYNAYSSLNLPNSMSNARSLPDISSLNFSSSPDKHSVYEYSGLEQSKYNASDYSLSSYYTAVNDNDTHTLTSSNYEINNSESNLAPPPTAYCNFQNPVDDEQLYPKYDYSRSNLSLASADSNVELNSGFYQAESGDYSYAPKEMNYLEVRNDFQAKTSSSNTNCDSYSSSYRRFSKRSNSFNDLDRSYYTDYQTTKPQDQVSQASSEASQCYCQECLQINYSSLS